MPLLQRKPKPAPAPATPLEEAIAKIHAARERITALEAELAPLRGAQMRAHRAARGGPKATAADSPALARVAADYFLGHGQRDAVDAALAETASNDNREAAEQRAVALALAELDRRIRPLESRRDAARAALKDAEYRALRAYAEQLDAERRALLQKQVDLLASIYAVADLMYDKLAPGREAIAPPSFARIRSVEIPPTQLQTTGYVTFLDDKRQAQAAQQVVAHLAELGVVEA
ncbi:MAG: hypothetical protein AB1761_17760 [Pseudomonadota bacterium]